MDAIETLTSAEFDIKALKAPGPVILDFYQASCAPCRALEPRLERVARQFHGAVTVYRIDIDRDLPMAQRFRVRSIPTLVLLRAGREVERLDGLITERDLTAAFERATVAAQTEAR